MTHTVTYLSMAPKSNALYTACEQCKSDIRNQRLEPVPLQLRNAPTKLMKELDYGKDYEYAHNAEERLTKMECLPESMKGTEYYHPTEFGEEKLVKEHLSSVRKWKREPE